MIIDSETLKGLPEVIINLLNGGFFSALCGAGFGAWGAHKIAQAAKSRELILDEIRNTNVAIMLAFHVCNNYMALKRQITAPMIKNYNEIESKFETYNPIIDGVFSFTADYEKFKAPHTPIEQLNNFTLEKITLNGRVLAAISSLNSSSISLNEMIENRNQLISNLYEIRKKIDPTEAIIFYLGLKSEHGTDKTYPDTIKAIDLHTDEVIFFSKIACEDLIEHGDTLSKKYKKKYKSDPPKLNRLSFDNAEALGLLPPVENYEGWLQGFREQNELKPKSKKLVLRWPITFTEKPVINQ